MKRLLLAALGLATVSASAATKPNILLIVADDAGYADFGFQGGGIKGDYARLTPNLDRLTTNGVRFSNGYLTAPICCPSRAGLLTGRYQQRLGIHDNFKEFGDPDAGLPTFQPTLADRLRGLGYRTYAVGKWHLGSDTPHHPNQRGFDELFGFLGGARNYGVWTNYMGEEKLIRLQRNGNYINETNGQPYLTDFLGLAASNYLAAHAANFPTNPFFMYLAFNAVHRPNEALSSDLANTNVQAIADSNRQVNAAMTLALDRAVGVVLSQLTNQPPLTNTLVVFLSDNGGPENNEELNSKNWSDNGPLRGVKDTLYEGGIRVPFVMSWAGTISNAPGGRVIADPVITLDLLPTFIAAASTNVYPEFATDGVNLLPRLTGLTTHPIQRCLFWQSTGYLSGTNGDQSAVRQGYWKLYRGTNGVSELYDLASDIGENNNLAAAHPEKVTELLAAHAEWERGVIESLSGRVEPRSTPGLEIDASPLGYVLQKTTAGFGFMTYEMRESLSLSNDWSVTWSIQTTNPPGNGYLVLGDG
ncbi:MAG: sulfatase-like hydrolase/transferase, partial [Gammaproteobacteria bacterium]